MPQHCRNNDLTFGICLRVHIDSPYALDHNHYVLEITISQSIVVLCYACYLSHGRNKSRPARRSAQNLGSLLLGFGLIAEDFIGHVRQGFEGWSGEIKALKDVDAGFIQPMVLIGGFHPFGNYFNLQVVADLPYA